MTTKIKTRIEAKKASMKKWASILKRLEKLQGDVTRNCGFCNLAKYKTKGKDLNVYRCQFCEPDAEKLCRAYITNDQIITKPLREAWDQTQRLLNKIKALPDVYEEE